MSAADEVIYRLVQLPELTMISPSLPLDPEKFIAPLENKWLKEWCSRIFDWLRIANFSCQQKNLPLPFPGIAVWPGETDGPHPLRLYYEKLTGKTAPRLIRKWAKHDAAIMAFLDSQSGQVPPFEADLNLLPADLANQLEAAPDKDQLILDWQDQTLARLLPQFEPLIVKQLFAYAIRLMVLVRAGRRY